MNLEDIWANLVVQDWEKMFLDNIFLAHRRLFTSGRKACSEMCFKVVGVSGRLNSNTFLCYIISQFDSLSCTIIKCFVLEGPGSSGFFSSSTAWDNGLLLLLLQLTLKQVIRRAKLFLPHRKQTQSPFKRISDSPDAFALLHRKH